MKLLLIFMLVYSYSFKSYSQDFYKRFVGRVGYGMTDLEATDSQKRKATTSSNDIFVHVGIQMKLSPLWSGQFELILRNQIFAEEPKSNSLLVSGQFDFRRRILPRFDAAISGGIRQENFLYGDGSGELAVKRLSLPSLGIITYTELFRFLVSGISLKLAYFRYFSSGSDPVNVDSGNALRAGLVYLLRVRNIDWSLEYVHERAKFEGNYDQENVLNSITLGMAYE